MMEIPLEDVRHMARLSMLKIDAEEEKLFARQFGGILKHMEILQAIDTENVEPLYSPVVSACPIRKDFAENIRSRPEILANAPETDGESFVVPRIV